FHDACMDSATINRQPIGVASLDFMNYTDDTAMQLFTPDQAAVMASQVAPGGENYTLTQHPEVLNWPANYHASVAGISGGNLFDLFPNPSSGTIYLAVNNTGEPLKEIKVTDVAGRAILRIDTSSQQKNLYSIDL